MGLSHGEEIGRRLRRERSEERLRRSKRDLAAHEVGTFGVVGGGFGDLCAKKGAIEGGRGEHFLEGRANKHFKSDHRRGGISGESKDQALLVFSEEQRFSRAHGDAPKVGCDAKGIEGRPQQIVIADGGSA